MISTLEIKNFKSILDLKLDCRRVNVFIGEPNTGKSNILESLGLLSYTYYGRQKSALGEFVRYDTTPNLYYDQDLDNALEIHWDSNSLVIGFQNEKFQGRCQVGGSEVELLAGNYKHLARSNKAEDMGPFKFYRFRVHEVLDQPVSGYLLPPSGDNLVALLMAHKAIRSLANDLVSPTRLRLGVRVHERKLELVKSVEDIIISYPYVVTSDTFQRLLFYLAAIESNKDSVLIFEEPEAHAFPYYTKHLAEVIGLDDSKNQYFITTHNPYFLLPLVEKCPAGEIAVFVTYYEDFQTKVKLLSDEEMQELTEMDVFSNLEVFLNEE